MSKKLSTGANHYLLATGNSYPEFYRMEKLENRREPSLVVISCTVHRTVCQTASDAKPHSVLYRTVCQTAQRAKPHFVPNRILYYFAVPPSSFSNTLS